MTWQPYNLDREAQRLVLEYRDKKGVLNESHKMRMTVSYGLERFWGEHLRLIDNKNSTDKEKGKYWRDVWQAFTKILSKTEIKVPKGNVDPQKTDEIVETAKEFWDQDKFPLEDQRIALTILTQFCDSLVWWTQRYKK